MKSSKLWLRFWWEEDGPTAVEYAIMLAMIVLTCLATIHQLAQATGNSFNSSADAINDAVN